MIPPIVFFMFFLSGAASLIYQIVWVRLAMASFGVITPVLSIVLAVFMGGIYLGSIIAAKTCSKLERSRVSAGLILYGIAEVLMALGAVAVPKLYALGERLLLQSGESQSNSYLFYSAAVIIVAILPWCICMGLTVPWMLAYLKRTNANSPKSFSGLYLANLLGAMAGALAAVVFSIELMGFRATALIGAAFNIFNGIAAFALSMRSTSAVSANSSASVVAAESRNGNVVSLRDKKMAYVALFLTGFVSLALEVSWTRAFSPLLGTMVYAFGAVLFTYLGATALGSRYYRSGKCNWSFQKLLGWAAVSSFLPLILNDPRLQTYIFVTLFSVMPFCFLLGILTPKIIDECSEGDPADVGRLYAVNVIGCILGPVIAGYFLLPTIGVKWTMISMAFLLGVLATIWEKPSSMGFSVNWLRSSWRGAFVGFAILCILVMTGHEEYYASPRKKGEVRRDYAATVISYGEGMTRRLLVNGFGITFLTTITKAMAHLPMAFLEQTPKKSLVICFGMGTTFRSLATWGHDVTAVELVPSVIKAFGYYHADADEVASRPGSHIVVDDGRRFLKRTDQIFDVITLDPPPPVEAAGSGLLYTKEFYAIVKSRLSPKGMLAQWLPPAEPAVVHAVTRALAESFPYIEVFYSAEKFGFHFLASESPIVVPDVDTMLERMPEAAENDIAEWLPQEWKTVETPRTFLDRVLANRVSIKDLMGNPDVVMIDDHPVNEYFFMRHLMSTWKASEKGYF